MPTSRRRRSTSRGTVTPTPTATPASRSSRTPWSSGGRSTSRRSRPTSPTTSHTPPAPPTPTPPREQGRRAPLPPFQADIAHHIDSIMTAHIVVPALDPSGDPATLSKPIMTGILRNQLHYDGVVITDSLG